MCGANPNDSSPFRNAITNRNNHENSYVLYTRALGELIIPIGEWSNTKLVDVSTSYCSVKHLSSFLESSLSLTIAVADIRVVASCGEKRVRGRTDLVTREAIKIGLKLPFYNRVFIISSPSACQNVTRYHQNPFMDRLPQSCIVCFPCCE